MPIVVGYFIITISLCQKKQKLEFCFDLLGALEGWYGDPTKRSKIPFFFFFWHRLSICSDDQWDQSEFLTYNMYVDGQLIAGICLRIDGRPIGPIGGAS